MNTDAIFAALAERKRTYAAGPRTVSELARFIGVSQSSLHQALTGVRPMPATMTAAILAALPELLTPP